MFHRLYRLTKLRLKLKKHYEAHVKFISLSHILSVWVIHGVIICIYLFIKNIIVVFLQIMKQLLNFSF